MQIVVVDVKIIMMMIIIIITATEKIPTEATNKQGGNVFGQKPLKGMHTC